MREFKGYCQQCYTKTSTYIMSMYSERLICMKCKEKETKRDDYQDTSDADALDYLRRHGLPTESLERQIRERKEAK